MGSSKSKLIQPKAVTATSYGKNGSRKNQDRYLSKFQTILEKKREVKEEKKLEIRLKIQSELDEIMMNYTKYPQKAFELLYQFMNDYLKTDASRTDMDLERYLSHLLEKSILTKNIPFSKYLISEYILNSNLCKQENLMSVVRYAFQTGDTHFIDLMIKAGGNLSKEIPEAMSTVILQAFYELTNGQGKATIVSYLFEKLKPSETEDGFREFFQKNYNSTKPDEFRLTPADWQAIKWDKANIKSAEFLEIKKDIQSGKKIYSIQDNELVTQYNCRFYSTSGVLRCQYFTSYEILALAQRSKPKRSVVRKVRETLISKSIEEAKAKSREEIPKFKLPIPIKRGEKTSRLSENEIVNMFTPVANYKTKNGEKKLKEILTGLSADLSFSA